MNWDKAYSNQGNVWSDQPSELAVFAADFLSAAGTATPRNAMDIGCGYGRDAVYLSRRLGCSVTGIDSSSKAVSMALESRPPELSGRVKYRCADFKDIDKSYPVIFASNLYQVLPKSERAMLADTIIRNLSPSGLLFLSTLSTSDPKNTATAHRLKAMPIHSREKKFSTSAHATNWKAYSTF